mmetsp:Transcript_18196/g.56684  ORF Transcript_18196/g.56684 Transcript_18196/m.56684 type:complete len:118 (-) Transcript_18196:48-401(-)
MLPRRQQKVPLLVVSRATHKLKTWHGAPAQRVGRQGRKQPDRRGRGCSSLLPSGPCPLPGARRDGRRCSSFVLGCAEQVIATRLECRRRRCGHRRFTATDDAAGGGGGHVDEMEYCT